MARSVVLAFMAALAGGVAFCTATGAQDRERNPGGDPVKIDQHPWHAAIEVSVGGKTQLCSGALVHSRVVLTAASCLYGSKEQRYPEASFTDVKVKTHVTAYATEGKWEKVLAFRVHAGFRPNQEGSVREHDLALMALERPAAGKLIRAADAALVVPAGQVLEVTGWGEGAHAGAGKVKVLRAAKLPKLDAAKCGAPMGMLCVGAPGDKGDVFLGDRGSPVVWHRPGGPVVVGVVSSFSAQPSRYAVSASVSPADGFPHARDGFWPKDIPCILWC